MKFPEQVRCCITDSKNRKLYVGYVTAPKVDIFNGSNCEVLWNVLNAFSLTYNHFLLLGYVNYGFSRWPALCGGGLTTEVECFARVLMQIFFATCYAAHEGDSILDLVVTGGGVRWMVWVVWGHLEALMMRWCGRLGLSRLVAMVRAGCLVKCKGHCWGDLVGTDRVGLGVTAVLLVCGWQLGCFERYPSRPQSEICASKRVLRKEAKAGLDDTWITEGSQKTTQDFQKIGHWKSSMCKGGTLGY